MIVNHVPPAQAHTDVIVSATTSEVAIGIGAAVAALLALAVLIRRRR